MTTTSPVAQLPLGKQGFVTSEQGIGMMSVGITVGSKDLYGKKNDTSVDGVTTLIKRCLASGVTHFDTAQAYVNLWTMLLGRAAMCLGNSSEKAMSAGLAATKGNWQVATKVPPPGDKAHVKNACYKSCSDLGVDCIDLYYLHRIDVRMPIEITIMLFFVHILKGACSGMTQRLLKGKQSLRVAEGGGRSTAASSSVTLITWVEVRAPGCAQRCAVVWQLLRGSSERLC